MINKFPWLELITLNAINNFSLSIKREPTQTHTHRPTEQITKKKKERKKMQKKFL